MIHIARCKLSTCVRLIDDMRNISAPPERLAVLHRELQWIRANRGVALLFDCSVYRVLHSQLRQLLTKDSGHIQWDLSIGR